MLVWKHFWISISAFIPYKHGEHIYQLFLHSATHLPWRSTLWFNYSLQKLSSSCLHFFAIIFNRKFMHGQLAPRTCTALMGGLSLCHHTARYVCIWLCQCRDWQLVQKKRNKTNKRITSFKQSHPEILLCTFRAGKSLDNHRAFSGRVVKQTFLLSQGGPRGHLFHMLVIPHRSVSTDRKPQAQSLDLEASTPLLACPWLCSRVVVSCLPLNRIRTSEPKMNRDWEGGGGIWRWLELVRS